MSQKTAVSGHLAGAQQTFRHLCLSGPRLFMALAPGSIPDCFPWLSPSVTTNSPISYGDRGDLKALTLSWHWWWSPSLHLPDPCWHNREPESLVSSLTPPVYVPIAEDLGFQVTKFPSLTSSSDISSSINICQAVFQILCPTSLIVPHRSMYLRQGNGSRQVL